jgi:hypothetical protein
MNSRILLALLATYAVTNSSHASDFGSFPTEVGRFKSAYPACQKEKIIPASSGSGALFGCVLGKARTAKYFINEVPKTSRVENVKVMWNDWFNDIGYGLHADKPEAEAMLKAAAKLYAPAVEGALLSAFRSVTNKTIRSNGFSFLYTHERGPKIDERLITITKE